MRVFYDLDSLPVFRNAVLTIGSFDGVHCGHQRLLAQIQKICKDCDGESVVVTFHPHPRLVLQPGSENTLRLLTTIEEKIIFLEKYGVQNVVVVPFSLAFAAQSPEAYIKDFLVKRLHPFKIVVGYDHRYGENRAGDTAFLKQFEATYQYNVVEIPAWQIDDITVSSTKIRKSLEDGVVPEANEALGHPYMISGTVVRGKQLGRTIGFPTANLEITKKEPKLIPQQGVYAVLVNVENQCYKGMLSIGNRPTVDNGTDLSIETNIFDFNEDIYDKKIQLSLISFIRFNKKFENIEALKTQLAQDAIAAQEVLSPKITMPKVAIVILNYNGRAYLEQFLVSVVNTSYPHLDIIVADNGSTDDSIDFINKHYKNIKVIDLQQNMGYAGGYNETMKYVKADYYVLLNSDVAVDKDWLQPLVEAMESDKTIGAAQPKVLSYHRPDYFEHAGASGGYMDALGYPYCRGRVFYVTEKDVGQYESMIPIFWASGAAFCIRHDLFTTFGGFDAQYFAHMEEIDLCWRLKHAGYKIMVVPQSKVWHVGGATLDYQSPRKTYMNFRNSLSTIFKNFSIYKCLWLIPLRLVLDGMAGVMYLFKGEFSNIIAIIKAHLHFYALIPSLLKKRRMYKKIIKNNKIGASNRDGYLDKSIVWAYFIKKIKRFSELGSSS